MAFTDVLSLIKAKLSDDVATFNNAHSTNVDILTDYIASLVVFVNSLDASIIALESATVTVLNRYSYELDVVAANGVAVVDSDGTSVTRNNLVFDVIHIRDLTNAMLQVRDNNGRLVTDELELVVDLITPMNLEITLPVAFPTNLTLTIIV